MTCSSAILAHLMLNERLNIFGVLGCALCIVGSCVIVLHAPPEREVASLIEIWRLAMQPGMRVVQPWVTQCAASLPGRCSIAFELEMPLPRGPRAML